MTDTFHAYVANQLAAQLKQRRIVVWYDARSELTPFIEQLTSEATDGAPVEVDVAGTSAHLVVDDGSRYSTRFRVEPLVAGDEPGCVVVYLPGVKRDHHSSVLMELETAGRAGSRSCVSSPERAPAAVHRRRHRRAARQGVDHLRRHRRCARQRRSEAALGAQVDPAPREQRSADRCVARQR
jgi:hypothetical protein